MGRWIDIGADAEIADGEPFAGNAEGLPVAIFRLQGRLHALHDLCSHGAARLSEGWVEGDCVECPLHQGLVEIATGEPKSPPITEPIRTFPVRVMAGRVEVEV